MKATTIKALAAATIVVGLLSGEAMAQGASRLDKIRESGSITLGYPETSVPFAYLWEMGRGTIWAPAMLHTAIDAFKLVVIPVGATLTFSLALAAVSVVVPLLVLAVPRTSDRRERRATAARPAVRRHTRRSAAD